MARPILIVRIPESDNPIDPKWFDNLSDYYIFLIYDSKIEEIQFEFPKNCDLPQSDLDKIKEVVLING